MAVSSWVATDAWEVLFLGGKRMPGVATVEISLASGLEVQKARGKKKARVKDGGIPPADVSIELELLPDEMPALERVIDLLRPRSTHGERRDLEIGHPNAKLWGVNRVKIKTIGSPQPGPGGSYTLKFTALEHTDTPTKVKKKASAKPTNEDPTGWDIDPLIDGVRPAQQGGAALNFSSDQNFSSGDIAGSGF